MVRPSQAYTPKAPAQALIEDPTVIRRILSHLGLPTDVPAARPARPPPLALGRSAPSYGDDVSVP